MLHLQNWTARDARKADKEEATEVEDVQPLDLSKFYHYLQTIKNAPATHLNTSKTGFANRKLKDIGKSLLETLNRGQTSYDKHWVGSICVFISLINIRPHRGLVNKLKQPFFASLAPVLLDILQFWGNNREGPKAHAARAKLVAFCRLLIQLPAKKAKYLPAIYNHQMLQVLCSFQLPNDEGILRLFSQVIFLASQTQSLQHSKKLAFNLYRGLQHPNFPVPLLPRCLEFIKRHQDSTFYTCSEQVTVVKNLCAILRTNLEANKQQINLCYLLLFLNTITLSSGEPVFNFSQLRQLVKGVKNSTLTPCKIECLKMIARSIAHFPSHLQAPDLQQMSAIGDTFLGLQIIAPIFTKLSSAGLMKLIIEGLWVRLTGLVADKMEKRSNQFQVFKVLIGLTLKIKAINFGLFLRMAEELRVVGLGLEGIYQQEGRKLLELNLDGQPQFSFL